jgi:hypothetical protein
VRRAVHVAIRARGHDRRADYREEWLDVAVDAEVVPRLRRVLREAKVVFLWAAVVRLYGIRRSASTRTWGGSQPRWRYLD